MNSPTPTMSHAPAYQPEHYPPIPPPTASELAIGADHRRFLSLEITPSPRSARKRSRDNRKRPFVSFANQVKESITREPRQRFLDLLGVPTGRRPRFHGGYWIWRGYGGVAQRLFRGDGEGGVVRGVGCGRLAFRVDPMISGWGDVVEVLRAGVEGEGGDEGKSDAATNGDGEVDGFDFGDWVNDGDYIVPGGQGNIDL